VSYKNRNWNEWDISYLKTFGTAVPVYSPSVFREYRGEIFTTYHSSDHPVNDLIPSNSEVHGRFSKSYTGVLRGLHYDSKTYKLVQAVVGDIYLVVLDRNTGNWESFILSEKTRDQVLIPPGYANGHYAVTDCIFHYNMFYVGDYVDENAQGVIKWNDSKYNIEWPTTTPILQNRDK